MPSSGTITYADTLYFFALLNSIQNAREVIEIGAFLLRTEGHSMTNPTESLNLRSRQGKNLNEPLTSGPVFYILYPAYPPRLCSACVIRWVFFFGACHAV